MSSVAILAQADPSSHGMATVFPASQAIVVGGGLAGVSAANTILEHGGNVILLDKSAATSALRTSNRLQTL